MRSTELLVIVDREVRLASLSEFKATHERGQDPADAKYKVLHLPRVTFPILSTSALLDNSSPQSASTLSPFFAAGKVMGIAAEARAGSQVCIVDDASL